VLRGHNVPLLAVATWRLHLAQELLSRYDRLVVVDAPETEDVGAA
jgi:hypothetical protein